MSALIIWGEDDHQVRAKAMATTYNATAQAIQMAPSAVPALDTLVFWGHGDPWKFCSLESGAFVDLIASWRKLNPNLRTIEMITCNLRHRQSFYTDSYTEQVIKQLSRKLADIKFKALPVAVTPAGNTADFSILNWHPRSATWAYVAAPGADDKLMNAASNNLDYLMPPNGDAEGYVRAHAALRNLAPLTLASPFAIKNKYDQAQLDKFNLTLAEVKSNSYILAGTIGLLRWCLVELN